MHVRIYKEHEHAVATHEYKSDQIINLVMNCLCGWMSKVHFNGIF